MELQNRVINKVLRSELHRLGLELWAFQLSLPMRFHTVEKCVEIEKDLNKLGERVFKTPTKLSKGNMIDGDANFWDTLRDGFTGWETRGLLDKVKRLYADVSAKVDEIAVKSWQKLSSCEEPVDKVWYAVVVSTVALLSIVYQYLLGYVLKGGTKAYSSGSLDFRDTFVSLLLFQGSYVWIFFRDVAAKRTVYRRLKKDGTGRVRYEPRFKPHRERQPAGTVPKSNYLPLGGYDSHRDAEIMCQIGGYYYKRDEAEIKLRDGSIFTIPPMPEHEQSLFGEDKVRCVVARAKEVFKDVQLKNNAIILPSESNTVGVRDRRQDVGSEKFSVDAALKATDVYPVDWAESLGADGEGLGGTQASPSLAEQVVRPQSLDRTVSNDADSMTKQESSVQQLIKEQLEAFGRQITEQLEAFYRRITEQHEQHLQREKQHLQREKQLEEHIAQLQMENELLKMPHALSGVATYVPFLQPPVE